MLDQYQKCLENVYSNIRMLFYALHASTYLHVYNTIVCCVTYVWRSCVRVCVCVCVCVCVRACVCVCACACVCAMHVYVCVYMCIGALLRFLCHISVCLYVCRFITIWAHFKILYNLLYAVGKNLM